MALENIQIADLYYTLFGSFVADALDLKDTRPSLTDYVEKQIRQNPLQGVYLHCAAILPARLAMDDRTLQFLRNRLQQPKTSRSEDI